MTSKWTEFDSRLEGVLQYDQYAFGCSEVHLPQHETACSNSFKRQFVEDDQPDSHGGLRLSQIGRPAVLQALGLFGYTEGVNIASAIRFITGDFTESLGEFIIKCCGYSIHEAQGTVYYEGVKGHYDWFIDGDTVVDCKSMSANSFRKFTADPNQDYLGYTSQLAVYRAALDISYAGWLLFDKGGSGFKGISPSEESLAQALNRANRIIPKLNDLSNQDDILKVFQAPPPVLEVHKKKETEKYVIPDSMRYSPYRYLFYDVEVEKNGYYKSTEYVVGVKSSIDWEAADGIRQASTGREVVQLLNEHIAEVGGL